MYDEELEYTLDIITTATLHVICFFWTWESNFVTFLGEGALVSLGRYVKLLVHVPSGVTSYGRKLICVNDDQLI